MIRGGFTTALLHDSRVDSMDDGHASYSVDILTLTADAGKDGWMVFVYSVHGPWPVPPHKHPINAVSKIITELV